MDLELNKIPMEGYACALETTLCQEETQESIVPDACPDIRRVICTEARAQLTRREAEEGKLTCAGSVRLTVVYLPEDGEGPRHMELTIPFRAEAAGAVSPGCPAVASAAVTAAETRVLNPRKVLCRVELAVWCQVWRPREEALCLPGETEGVALEERVEELETYTAVAVAEKPFAFTDDVTLPASHPRAEELLGHRLELRRGEAKVIGGKLIFKGEVILLCRYRSAEGALALGRWELPFSQLMELEDAAEEGSCEVELVERESEVALAGDDEGRALSVHLELLAQAVVRQNRTVRLFTDAYSTTHALAVERQSLTLTQLWEESGTNQLCREVLETGETPRQVEDCAVTLGPCQVRREEREGVLAVQARVSALYTDETGQLRALERTAEFSTRIALPGGGECRCRCALAGEVQALAAAGGIELRCPVRFDYRTTVPRPLETVTALQAEEREEEPPQPSVRLRLAQRGEDLWDIAKACSAARADILAANDLPDPDHLEGTLLLIPRSR